MRMTTLKKGDRVYFFNAWDRKGTVSWREFEIVSIGKVRAHVITTEGKNLRHQIYFTEYGKMIRVGDCPDPKAEALDRSARLIASEHEHYDIRINSVWSVDSPGYKREMERMKGELHKEPTAAPYEELAAIVKRAVDIKYNIKA